MTPGTAAADHADVIRNTVLHLASEQPLLADLYSMPGQSDAGILCTNVRMMDGKRPAFIDSSTSTFIFPYHVMRFLEIPPAELAKHQAEGGDAPAFTSARQAGPVASGDGAARLPVVVGGPTELEVEDIDIELDIDEDFLQRVRDI